MNVTWIIVAMVVMIVLISCAKPKRTLYTINKGEHRSVISVFAGKPSISFFFTFTSEHKYLEKENTTQVNKLYGLTSLSIHKNSARFGWKELPNGKFGVYSYYYLKGNRSITLLYEAEIGELLYLRIDTDKKQWAFTVSGRGDTHRMILEVDNKLKYRAYPYFGGTITAPSKMNFRIEEL